MRSRKNRKELPAFGVIKDIKIDINSLVKYCITQELLNTNLYDDIKVIKTPATVAEFETSQKRTIGMQDFVIANSYSKENFFKEKEADYLQGENYKQLYLTEFDHSKRSKKISPHETNIFERSKRLNPEHPSYLPEADEYNYGIRNSLVCGEIEKVLDCFKSPLARVRFANLSPNFKLKPHIDYDPSLSLIHI